MIIKNSININYEYYRRVSANDTTRDEGRRRVEDERLQQTSVKRQKYVYNHRRNFVLR